MGENIGTAEVELERPHVIAFNIWQDPDTASAPREAWACVISPSSYRSTGPEKVLDRLREKGLNLEKHPEGMMVQDLAGIRVLLAGR